MKNRMKRLFLGAIAIIAVFLCGARVVSATERTLPLIHGARTVALVNGEPVDLADLESALALRREATGGAKAGRKETLEVLRRLIDSRLAVQEGRKIGLDQLPETRRMVEAFAGTALREELMEKRVGKLAIPKRRRRGSTKRRPGSGISSPSCLRRRTTPKRCLTG